MDNDSAYRTMNLENKARIKGIVDQLVTLASDHSEDEWAYFTNILCHATHPTHQQRIFKLVYRLIKDRAESDRCQDGRNKDSREFCQDVMALPPYWFSYI